MNAFLVAPSIMLGIALIFGIIIAVSSKLLRVDEDPRIEGTNELLPGNNCGACGVPGCLAFAEKLVAGLAAPSQCTVSSASVIESIAEYLEMDAGAQEKMVARLKCGGGSAQAHQIAEYRGFDSCRAAALVSAGGKGCAWGCLGLGDCEVACTFEAIHINANGLPQVDVDKCTACPDCTAACPRDLFEVVPMSHKLYVQCSSPLAGDAATILCSTACDACGKCAADAAGLVRMEGNLPVVDYTSGIDANPRATFRCATNSIVWLEGNQFEDQETLAVERERYG